MSFLCSILEAVLLSINTTFIKIELKEGKKYAKKLSDLKNSIDEPMWSIICNKVNITSTALEGTRTSLKAKKTKVKQNEKDGTGSSSRQQNDNIVESDSKDEMKEFGKGDVRTFISKLGEKKKNALQASWSCDVCTLINPQKHTRCLAQTYVACPM